MVRPFVSEAVPRHVWVDAPSDRPGRPRVSVIMSIFNNGRHVAQAIDSVLAQDLIDHGELILADDCSTDDTRDILQAYKSRFPSTIRLAVASRNTRGIEIFQEALRASAAEYIALIDGDDFWTAPDKLRKQVQFLDDHPQCSMCFHNVLGYYEDETHEPFEMRPYPSNGQLQQRDLLERNWIVSCSPLIRTAILQALPDWVFELELGDWAMYVMAAEHGDAGYLDDAMAAYRIHPNGAWSTIGRRGQLEGSIRFYDELRIRLGNAHAAIIDKQREVCRQELRIHAWTAWTAGDHLEALKAWTALARHDAGGLAEELQYRFVPGDGPDAKADRSPERAAFEGFQEPVNDFVVTGWAWDSSAPETPIDIDILDGDTVLATVSADTFRTDLRDAGKGHGYHAFACRLPERLRDGRPHRIGTRIAGTAVHLTNSGAIVAFADPERPDERAAMRAEETRWLEQDLAPMRTDSSTLETDLVALDRHIVDLRRELVTSRAAIADARTRQAASRGETARLEDDVAVTRDLERATRELQDLRRERDAARTEREGALQELEEFRSSPSRWLGQLVRLLRQRSLGRSKPD